MGLRLGRSPWATLAQEKCNLTCEIEERWWDSGDLHSKEMGDEGGEKCWLIGVSGESHHGIPSF